MANLGSMPIYKDRDWLMGSYWEDELTIDEMAGYAGCSVDTIRVYMRQHSVPVRSYSERQRVAWRDADKRKAELAERSSAMMTKRWATDEWREFWDAMWTDEMRHWRSEESKRILTECWADPEFRERRRIAMADPDVRQRIADKMSIIAAERWNDPEYRALLSGANHHLWNGGSSNLPYAPEFTELFKEAVRARDGYVCMLCGVDEDDVAHNVHHIDYNKMNTDMLNCVTLCVSCHAKTNYNRDMWRRKFALLVRYGIERIPII